MPSPNAGESKEDFIARFMASPKAKSDYPDEDQRYAVALSMWKDGRKSQDSAIMYDSAPVSGVRRTSDGYLVAEARVARTGIQIYRGSDIGLYDKDTVRVYRPPEEVFGREAMRTYANRPVTMEHPPQMVDADSWKSTAIGQTGEDVVRDGEYVRVPLLLMDGEAINVVSDGTKKELSMGYTAEIEIADGTTPDGERYDAIQRNLRMNHLAVVAKARGGSELRIGDTRNHGAVDMADAIKTRTVLVDGLPIETTDAGAQAIEKLQGQVKDAEQKVQAAEAEHNKTIEAKDAELAKKDAKIDELQSKVLDESALDERVAQRADLITKAKRMVDGLETDGKSDSDIRKAVVVSKLGDSRVEGKSQAYIDASFDLLVDQAEKDRDGFKSAMADGVSTTGDKTGDPDKAYAENVANLQDAWKRKEA